MATVEQKRAYNKLKHDLEPWRNLIVHLDSFLSWEKQFYPAIIAAIVSVFYLTLWAMNLSIVTMLSLGGLVGVAFDFVYPSVSRFLFNPDNWDSRQEEQFEKACAQLCNLKATLMGWYEYLFNAKDRKSTIFVIIISVTLIAFAWIGAVINNLLLMYLLTLALVMYPGMLEKHIIHEFKEKIGSLLNSKIQQIRDKSPKSE